ncbi:OLC1v1008599C1 [Oldenlandia corymbosa var. corymbosa]|uniref:OLC1v1008599C1 n=1 Tax=Oldenlandia corymbosa var. corymbosa TaxID=529605 RepID=A0AAV1DM25_OLDCO|nr:OLC1v1008599C1 [Oldenlandia corymbosa var. corymbosa]
MPERFEACPLVGTPQYPNAVAWSDENLVAAASGQIVTIMRPAASFGSPRGTVTLSPTKPFPIGVINREDLRSPCLLPICLSRDVKPCVRSISWSPIGFAPNAGCLLAVCTTEGRVTIYRMPYCEYAKEWIQVMDISDMLYAYLASVNFFEEPTCLSRMAELQDSTKRTQGDQRCAEIQPTTDSEQRKRPRRQKRSTLVVVEIETQKLNEDEEPGMFSVPDSGKKEPKQSQETCSPDLISAEQYASRSRLLSSLIVAWSPILPLTSGIEETNSIQKSSLLAVGGKSGRISFWRFDQPTSYSILNGGEAFSALLIGLLQAHDFDITALSWEIFVDGDAANPLLLLASGSTNGCVKIWKAYASEVMKSSEAYFLPLYLLNEVLTMDCGIVSVLSLFLPRESPGEMVLAIGQGSGLLEIWIGNLNSSKFEREGYSEAHNHILMGLAWGFGGKCLYSCSQDGSIRSWILSESILREVPFPSNIPGIRSPSNLSVPCDYDLCFGLAISPGNLTLAVAHSFDSGLLNPMYEARIQKAVVEYLWIGGQQLDLTVCIDERIEDEAIPDFPTRELISWEQNLLWSFKQHEHGNKPLVIWDIVASMLALRQCVPNHVVNIIIQWLRSLFGSMFEVSPAFLFETSKRLSNITSRQLQLLNVIGRRVFIREPELDKTISKGQGVKELGSVEEEQNFWLRLVGDSEREIRERLFAVNCLAILRSDSFFSNKFVNDRSQTPVGLSQMMWWVSLNQDDLKDRVKSLAAEIGNGKTRLSSTCERVDEERCIFCSASVPFESTEVAFCQGVKDGSGGDDQVHKLARCAVSMKVVSPMTPTWFCICCHRKSEHIPPPLLFLLSSFPFDLSDVSQVCSSKESAKPLCPFCGILLQRPQNKFHLSPCPV